ncbi:MAG TPA: hypothetical protein VG826_33960 [Pirellulales bacterium]|nr:hypothetical protein [Pirellulales bacterium]
MTGPNDRESTALTWVREVAGRPRIRWGRVAAFLAGAAAIDCVATLGVALATDMPINEVTILAPLCGAAGYLVLAVELQRQRLQTSQWRFRFGMGALLVLTAVAAAFFALTTGALRENQRLFAENQTLKSDIEAVMQGGVAWIGMPGGRGITCQVTRPGFSDADLARIIDLASRGGARSCELTTLFLGRTAVTNAGVRQLAACDKLIFVDLPPVSLSDDTIEALSKCRRLEFLLIDERGLTAAQIDRLRESSPRLRLNGRTWAEREGAK